MRLLMAKRLRDIYQNIPNNLPTTSVGQLPQNLEHVTDRRLAAANKHIQGPGAIYKNLPTSFQTFRHNHFRH